ncbi:MAG TPA: hypothetical protein VJ972_06440, partial [Anaerolineales bacterium]|nr:hypothetical protein [Anaerolineales bacterium]
MQQIIKNPVLIFIVTLLTACASPNKPAATSPARPEPTIITLSATPQNSNIPEQASIYTTHNLNGNHLIDGTIDLPNAAALDIPLEGKPTWLVSTPFEGDIVFAAVMDSGKVQAFKVSGSSYEPFNISPSQLPAGMPPVLVVTENKIELLTPPDDISPLTNPILVNSKLVYIGVDGDLVLVDPTMQTRLPVNALPDSHILLDENNRLLMLTQPTNRYDHGILGDEWEASAITLIETEPELRVAQNILIEAPDVIEGLSPIWTDIDNDG